MEREASRPGAARWVLPGLGLLLLLLIFPVFLASALLAPGWAVAALLAVWQAHVAVGVRWFWRHPVRVLTLPFVASALWLVTMYVGDLFLGWSA